MENVTKYRIEPSSKQEQQIVRTFGCCRYLYNSMLALRKQAYSSYGLSLSYNDTSEILTAMKRQEHTAWLKEVDATALQSALKQLDRAYDNFFAGRAKYPRFRRRHDIRQSYTTKCNYSWERGKDENGKSVPVLDEDGNRIPAGSPTIEVRPGAVKLPKLGWVKCRTSRMPEGRILNATVSRDGTGRYFVSICCEVPDPVPVTDIANPVGVDVGIKDIAITSDGEKYPNHKYLKKSEKKLKHAQRALSRKTKGSKRWQKQKQKLARIHSKIANQRQDNLHKVSHEIVKEHDAVFTEDLNAAGMLKNHCLAQAISDASFSELTRQLEYKCRREGKVFRKVGRFFASSQTCSVCGKTNPAVKDLSVREWDCPNCGAHHDRDVNAAINIRNEGLRLVLGS